jgi:phage terminase Nu1 subunit (DNA packaging protein)
MPKKPEIAGQIVNRNEMSGILGCSPGTLDRHVAAGCPIIKRGTTKTGHQFNSADVIRWVQARKSSAAVGQSDEGKRRYLLAVAELKEIQLAEKRGELVSIQAVTEKLADELTAVRGRLLAMPGRLAGQIAIMSDAAEIEAAIAEEVRGALSELSAG